VLGEFGDDPTRFADAASRRAYAGAAPITRASGRSRVVLMRRACNRRLADTCRWWAVAATQRDPRAPRLLPTPPHRRRRRRGRAAPAGRHAARSTAPLSRPPLPLRSRPRLAVAARRRAGRGRLSPGNRTAHPPGLLRHPARLVEGAGRSGVAAGHRAATVPRGVGAPRGFALDRPGTEQDPQPAGETGPP